MQYVTAEVCTPINLVAHQATTTLTGTIRFTTRAPGDARARAAADETDPTPRPAPLPARDATAAVALRPGTSAIRFPPIPRGGLGLLSPRPRARARASSSSSCARGTRQLRLPAGDLLRLPAVRGRARGPDDALQPRPSACSQHRQTAQPPLRHPRRRLDRRDRGDPRARARAAPAAAAAAPGAPPPPSARALRPGTAVRASPRAPAPASRAPRPPLSPRARARAALSRRASRPLVVVFRPSPFSLPARRALRAQGARGSARTCSSTRRARRCAARPAAGRRRDGVSSRASRLAVPAHAEAPLSQVLEMLRRTYTRVLLLLVSLATGRAAVARLAYARFASASHDTLSRRRAPTLRARRPPLALRVAEELRGARARASPPSSRPPARSLDAGTR